METRARIIDAAEKIFSKYGIEKASLRKISSEAGVNLAAINYHFGSKDNLIRESFVRLVLPLDAMREGIMEEARQKAGKDGLAVRDYVSAFLLPWFEFRRRHPEYIITFGQFYSRREREENQFSLLIREKAKEAYEYFLDEISAVVPGVAREELQMRINMAVTMATSVLVNNWLTERLEDLSGQKMTEEVLLNYTVRLIEFGLQKED